MDCDMTGLAKYALGFLGTNVVTNWSPAVREEI